MEKILQYDGARNLADESKPDSYLSYDSLREIPVVVRILNESASDDTVFIERFNEKMRRLERRDRHHIGPFYQLQSFESKQLAVREYIEGESVKQLITAEPFTFYLFLNLAIQIVKGLKVAHDCAVVHGNISSFNIIVSKRGEARLVDFCLPSDRNKDRSGSGYVGHLNYLSPEQLEGRVPSEASDLYSLGVVFYEMLTGELPFHGTSSHELRENILTQPPDFKADCTMALPSDGRLLLEKLLSRNPLHRGTNVTELLVTLQEIVANLPVAHAIKESPQDKWSPRTYQMLSVLALLLIILWLIVTTDF